jgi:RNA polymerase sigma-70 factor (ECF subfamily)
MMNGLNPDLLRATESAEMNWTWEREIVRAMRAGSPEAFVELHAMFSRRLFKTIIVITKSPEDAEDALQETFMRVYLAIESFEGRSSLYSWLTRIAINSALMVLRKRRARPEILFDPHPDPADDSPCLQIRDPRPDPEQLCDWRQRHSRLQSAIRNLDETLRKPIHMRTTRASSMKEISSALNISQAAVKARLHRARLRISAAFGEA